MENKPLVSVTVLTYNSASTVIETLESIKRQTYENIELLVSDDASTDNTIQVCREWLDANESRFVRTVLLTTEHNTGVPGNANRVIREARGEWKKDIAGDDILADTCVEDFIDYISMHPDTKIVFSKCVPFKVVNGEKQFQDAIPTDEQKRYYALSSKLQRITHYYWKFPFPGPATFGKMELYKKYPYDEKYDALEDYPFYMNLMNEGIHVDFMDKVTAYWRRGESLSSTKKYMTNPRLQRSKDMYFLDHQYNYLKEKYPEIFRYRMARHFVSNFMITFLKNKPTLLNRAVLKIVNICLRKDMHYSLDEVVKKYS